MYVPFKSNAELVLKWVSRCCLNEQLFIHDENEYDNVVLDQHVLLDFHSASSLKQHSGGRCKFIPIL